MKILINISNNLGGGGLQVARSFVQACRTRPENEYHVAVRRSLADPVGVTDFSESFMHVHIVPDAKFHMLGRLLSSLEVKIRPDVVFSVFGPSYWRSSAPQVMGFAIPHYIYPESPYWNTISFAQRIKISLKKRLHLLYLKRDADALICETEDATRRIEKLLRSPGKKYYTVSNTFGQQFSAPEKPPFSGRLPVKSGNDFWFLTLSKYYPHKNIEIIKDVLEILFQKEILNLHFILTISQAEYEAAFPVRYRTHVHTTGPVAMQECPSLYEHCDAVFLPTLLECFSANYPEAMISRKPILTSDLGFAKNICRDAALYFDPLCAKEIAKKVEAVSGCADIRARLIAAGLERVREFPDAETRARMYLDICKEMANIKST